MGLKPTITPEWRVPLYVVGSTVALAIYATIGYNNIQNKLDMAMTTQQAQDWIDNAREHNPAVNWPRLPPKKGASEIAPFRDAILTRREY